LRRLGFHRALHLSVTQERVVDSEQTAPPFVAGSTGREKMRKRMAFLKRRADMSRADFFEW